MTERIAKSASWDLDWLLDNNLPVYVGNTTRPAAAVLLSMITANGAVRPVHVPRTALPINVLKFVDKDTIRRSIDLRDFLRKGILTLIWPYDAEATLSTPEAMEEVQRLNLSEFSSRNKMVSPQVQKLQDAQSVPIPNQEPITEVLTPRVMDIINRLESNDTSPKAAMSELKAMERDLTTQDLAYVIANTEKQTQIKAYAQEVLSKHQTKSDDEALTPEQQAVEAQREAAARKQQKV